MDYVFLKNFIINYSLPSLIIALSVATINFVMEKLLGKKYPVVLKNNLPFVISLLLYIAFDMAFVLHSFTLREDALYSGILCGSLSLVISSIVDKLKRGERITVSPTALLIEGILRDIIEEERLSAAATTLEQLIVESKNTLTAESVAEIIKLNSEKQFTDEEYLSTAKLIISAVLSLQ